MKINALLVQSIFFILLGYCVFLIIMILKSMDECQISVLEIVDWFLKSGNKLTRFLSKIKGKNDKEISF